MRGVLAIALMALLTLSAGAQGMHKRQHQTAATPQSEAQKKKQRDAEKAYKSSLDQLPDKKFDPWAKVR